MKIFLNCSLVDRTFAENISHSSEQQEQTNNRDCDNTEHVASTNVMEEALRRRLAFHFMDPVEKFIARRQVPWKLLLQFLKGKRIIK